MAVLAIYGQSPSGSKAFKAVARLFSVLLVLAMISSGGVPLILDFETPASAGSLPSWTKTFHFHDGPDYTGDVYDWMNSTGPTNPTNPDYDLDGLDGVTIKKNVPPQRVHHWVLFPSLDNDTTITGDVTTHVWARSRGNDSATLVTTILYDMAPGDFLNTAAWIEIGRNTSPLAGPVYSDFKAYDITISSVNYTLLENHSLVVTMCRGDSLNDWLIVMFDQATKDSYVNLSAREFVKASSAWTADGSGIVKGVFTNLENPVVWTNVTDTFGAYEISGANLSVTYANNGTPVLPSVVMTLSLTDPSAPPYWKHFSATLPVLLEGAYFVNVTARDIAGSPTWAVCSFSVIGVDHFDVSAPPSIIAGQGFAMTVSAMNQTNSILTNWVGTVQLLPFRPDQVQPGNGTLTQTTVAINASAMGSVTITDQVYTGGEEEQILIRASSGSDNGWSGATIAHSGPVSVIQVSPGDQIDTAAGTLLSFTATGSDSCGNANSTWIPYWYVTASQPIGILMTDGDVATFLTTALGNGTLTCRDNLTGVSRTIAVSVISGQLARIDISPASFGIAEGETRALVATGYDSSNNTVDLPAVTWYTNTTGRVVGAGRYANFTAGMIPESGVIFAYSGTVNGTVGVTVVESPHGPKLSKILVQRQYEDVGSWILDLGMYWRDADGTSHLQWLAEGVNTSLYFISHDPESYEKMVFYTQPNANGNSTFKLWIIDELGFRTFQVVTVLIIPVPDAPVFVHQPPTQLYVKFDTPYTFDFTYYVDDVDTPKSALAMTAKIGGVATTKVLFDHLMGNYLFPTLSGTPYFEMVMLTVSDGEVSSDLSTIVWVTDDTPPDLNSTIAPITVFERCVRNDTHVDLDDYFYDQDSDYLIYDRGFEHILIEIDPVTHVVYVSAPEEWSGTTQGTFTATDPTGAIKVTTVTVIVIAVNNAPELVDIGDVHVKYNETYTLFLQSYVSDSDNSLDTLAFSLSSPHVVQTAASTGVHRLEFLFPPNKNESLWTYENYSVTVRLTVSDSEFTVWTDFKVFVGNNSPPSVNVTNPDDLSRVFLEDGYLNDSLRLNEIFGDSDDTKLFYDVEDWTHVRFKVDNSTSSVNMTADPNWFGTEVLTVRARDPKGGWAIVQITVTVIPVNDAPTILVIPDYIVKGGPRSFSYSIVAYILDPDDPVESLNISCTSDAPSATVSLAGGYLYVDLPKGEDVIVITLVASDSELMSNAVSFRVGVSKTMAELIGWPYSFPLVVLAAGVVGYFIASRMPKPHKLENVFLIHNDGRLVSHVTREENTNLDKDVVSAMFTAVQEFVRDSFQKGEVGLKKLEIGDKNVIIEKGDNAYLALIYTGWPDKQTFKSLAILLRDIEERYAGRLEKWNGTQKAVAGVEKMLLDFMSDAYKPGDWHDEEKLADQEWVNILEKET